MLGPLSERYQSSGSNSPCSAHQTRVKHKLKQYQENYARSILTFSNSRQKSSPGSHPGTTLREVAPPHRNHRQKQTYHTLYHDLIVWQNHTLNGNPDGEVSFWLFVST